MITVYVRSVREIKKTKGKYKEKQCTLFKIWRIYSGDVAIQTSDNEINHRIIYCLNCIRRVNQAQKYYQNISKEHNFIILNVL